MNNTIFYSIYSLAHRSVFLDKLIVFIAGNFGYLIIGIAVIFLLYHHDVLKSKNPAYALRKKWKEIILVFSAGVIAWSAAEVFKLIFHTPRPFVKLLDLPPLFIHGGMDSFPSGHATFFSALAWSLFFSHRNIGIFFMVFAVLIGLSRIASGVHFPIDILGGFVLGTMVAFLAKTL